MEDREFVIAFRRRWPLWTFVILAVLYFAGVITLVSLNIRIRGVKNEWLVWGGAGIMAVLVLWMLPLLFARKPRDAQPVEAVPVEAAPEWQDEAPEPVAPAPSIGAPRIVDDEKITTSETQQGLRVLEYSRPPKSRNKGSVYAKTYVPVTKEFVLRVETLAAEPRDL